MFPIIAILALTTIAFASPTRPLLADDKPIPRPLSNITICDGRFPDGGCTTNPVIPGTCVNLGSFFNKEVTSIQVPENQTCIFFAHFDCNDAGDPNNGVILSAGLTDLSTQNVTNECGAYIFFDDLASSFTCKFSQPVSDTCGR